MKKIVATFLLVLFIANNADAKLIKIYRRGSDDGVHYNKVTESNGLFVHSLSCTDPGTIECGWATSTPYFGDISADEIENFVISKINNNEYSGSTNYNGLAYVTWTYNPDTDELEITMNDGND